MMDFTCSMLFKLYIWEYDLRGSTGHAVQLFADYEGAWWILPLHIFKPYCILMQQLDTLERFICVLHGIRKLP